MARFDPSRVRDYYDRHTRPFVGLGEGRQSGAIHRGVWGPGVRNADEAIHYVDDRIAAVIRPLAEAGHPDPPTIHAPVHVVDLGCGVGATLVRLAQRLPLRATGVTLSPVQARLAGEKIAARGLTGRVHCIEADFCALPPAVGQADAAFAIESFVHAPDPSRFFEQCRQLIRANGLLIICDDFRGGQTDPGAAAAVERFCEGWHINTLLTPEELRRRAHDFGFDHQTTDDLTPYLRIPRPRDRVIGAFLAVIEWLPGARKRFDDLIGGQALQTCLRRGWITYQLAVFRRR